MDTPIAVEVRALCDEERYRIGFASLSGLTEPPWEKYHYGISIVRKLDDAIVDAIASGGPTKEYADYTNDVNEELQETADAIVACLTRRGVDAVAVEPTVPECLLDGGRGKPLRYSLSHKMVATRAGLGWIGKTDLLVTHDFGPRVRLASVLTAAKIAETGPPVTESLCGACVACVRKCPARVATGALWNTSVERDTFYDAAACRDYTREVSKRNFGEEVSVCGICLSVCPRGRASYRK